MKEYREMIDHIIDSDNREDMIELKIALDELMHELEKEDHHLFDKTINKLEDIIYNISDDEAKHIVHSMKPFAEHWSWDEVKNYIEQKGIYKYYTKYYLVMNMLYNDYYDVAVNYGHANDPEFFYELANAFINDVDAKPHKVDKYFTL